MVSRFVRLGPATGLGLLFAGAGGAAMAGLWAWFASPLAGRVFAVILLVASVAAIGLFGRRGELRRLDLSTPLLLALAVGLAFTGLAFLQGGIGSLHPAEAIETRFWAKSDNLVPLDFARALAAHQPLSGYMEGQWLFSDRPPLGPGSRCCSGRSGAPTRSWGISCSRPACRSPGCRRCGRCCECAASGPGRVSAVVLMTAATGAVFFNSVYVWPKMLAGSLAVAALAILISRDDDDRWAGAGILAVALATLSMLAHGGTAFALLALAPFVYLERRRITARAVVVCAAAAAALYLPWTLFQHFVDPPAIGSSSGSWRV